MADKQYKRKIADDAVRYPQGDPLSELARIVGYDPRAGDGRIAPRAEPELDLEAELLSELHEPGDAPDIRPKPSIERLDAVRPVRDGEPSWHARNASGPSAAASDDLDDALSHDIGASLEEELLRGFGEEDDSPLQSMSSGGETRRDEGQGQPAEHPESYEDPFAVSSALPVHAGRDEPDYDGSIDAPADDKAEPAGFVFPSSDQLEEDEGFAADAWWQGGRDEDYPSVQSPVDTAHASDRDHVAGSRGPERLDATLDPIARVEHHDSIVGGAVDRAMPTRAADEPVGETADPDTVSRAKTMQPVEAPVDERRNEGHEASAADDSGNAGSMTADPVFATSSWNAEAADKDVAAASEEDVLDDADGIADVVYTELHADRLAAAEGVFDGEDESDLDAWLRSAMEDTERPKAEPGTGNVVHLYGSEPAQRGAMPPEESAGEGDVGPEADDANKALAAKTHQIILSDRSGGRQEVATGNLNAPDRYGERAATKESGRLPASEAAPSLPAEAVSAVVSQSDDGELPFDPAAITEHDDVVEPTFDLDIPSLPAESEEEVAVAPIDDFDLDSDLADLLSASVPEAAAEDEDATQTVSPAPATSDATPIEIPHGQGMAATGHFEDVTAASTDFDELERAIDADLGAAYAVSAQPERAAPAEVIVGPVPRRATGGPRWQTIGAGVAALVVVGAVVFIGSRFVGGGSDSGADGGPRIITADKGPVKEKPAHPGGKAVPNQNKIVYDKVDGSKSTGPQQKTLVTTTEAPVDVVQSNLQAELSSDPSAASGEPDGIAPADRPAAASGTANGDGYAKSQSRLAPDIQAMSPASAAPAGIIPRYVETMTVTPDGRLVPANPQPNSPAVPASSSSGGQSASPGGQAAAVTPAPQAAAPATPATQSNAGIANAPVPVARPAAPVAAAPQTSAVSPSGQASAQQGNNAQTAAVQSPAAAKPGEYLIQIASQPTEAGAKASYQNLSRRYASVIGSKPYDIQKATIQGKGIYYRVRIVAGSRQDAVTLCENYRSSGGSCFVTR